MTAGILFILRCCGALSLLLLPAAPIAFPLFRSRFSFATTLAASVALGPFVVGIEWFALASLSVPFRLAVPIMAAAGLAALLPLRSGRFSLRRIRLGIDGWILLGVVLLLLPFACVLAIVPWLRVYGWHNMMQLAACYQVPNLPRPPEDWDMAGLRLNYPWFGLIHLTALARMLDASPTRIFPLFNVAQLLALIWIVRGIQRVCIESAAWAAHVLTVILYFLAVGLGGPLLEVIGIAHEVRLDPPIVNFLFIDAMTAGLALTALTLLIVVAYVRQPFGTFPVAAGIVFSALGLTYPLLYPAVGAILLAAFVVLRAGRAGLSLLLAAAPGLCVSAVALGCYLKWIGADGAAHIHVGLSPYIKYHLAYPPWQLGPWLALILLAGNGMWKSVEARITIVSAIVLSVAYCVVRMPLRVEYKLIAAAIVCLAPLAAARLHELSGHFAAGTRWIVAALLLFAVYDSFVLFRYASPKILDVATPVQDGSFWIDSADAQTRDWIRAVRERTPPQTVLLCGASYTPVSDLTRRALYLASDPASQTRPGYWMGTELMLTDLKGYPREEVQERAQLLRLALTSGNEADFTKVTTSLLRLGRPVAAVLEPSNLYGQWLRSSRLAEPVFEDGRTVVLLLRGPA